MRWINGRRWGIGRLSPPLGWRPRMRQVLVGRHLQYPEALRRACERHGRTIEKVLAICDGPPTVWWPSEGAQFDFCRYVLRDMRRRLWRKDDAVGTGHDRQRV